MKNGLLEKCNTCKLYIPQQKTCQIMPNLAGRINPDDFCSQHKNHLEVCELCGVGLLIPIIRVQDNVVHTYCENCIQRI